MRGRRPDGTGQIVGGILAAVAGVAGFLSTFFIKMPQYPTPVVDVLTMRWNITAFSGICLAISFLLFAAGWIIRAISFLPSSSELEARSGGMLELSETLPDDDTPSPLAWLVVGGVILFALLTIFALSVG